VQHTSTQRVKWLAILLPIIVLVDVLAWWQLRGGARATPPDADDETIVLNVEPGGAVRSDPLMLEVNSGRVTLDNQFQVRLYLKRLYEEEMRTVPPDERHKGPRVRFVIRADEGANPAEVEAVRVMCVEAGFKDIEVRPAVQ
jgi:hypothetical protein